jgi:curved DNA-binding protein CbpA
MAHRDPHVVLGVEPGSSQATIKAAWRRLAREHHPDLTAGDAVATRRSDRRMAEINAAYQALRDGAGGSSRARPGGGAGGRGGPSAGAPSDGAGGRGRRQAGPPPPPRTRPVTGRLDTSETIRPRNATTGRPARPRGQEPLRPRRPDREPLRASDPNGPIERGRLRRHRRPPDPALADAQALEIEFGKFRGHTLGQIAAFEPSYIDWVARTITRDRDLVAAARVIQSDMDERGVVRRVREAPARPSPMAGPSD